MTNSRRCQVGLEESGRAGGGGTAGGSQSLLSPGFGAAMARVRTPLHPGGPP